MSNLLDNQSKDQQQQHQHNLQNQKLEPHNFYGGHNPGGNHMMNPNGGLNIHIAPEYAEVGSNIPPGIGNVSPNLKTFYCGSECSSGPYAVTNMVTTPNGVVRSVSLSDKVKLGFDEIVSPFLMLHVHSRQRSFFSHGLESFDTIQFFCFVVTQLI